MLKKGTCITLDENEVEKILDADMPDDPHNPMIWVDENEEVVLATSSHVVKFRRIEDAQCVFNIVKELFNSMEGKHAGHDNVRSAKGHKENVPG